MYLSPFQSYGGLKKLKRSILLRLIVQDPNFNELLSQAPWDYSVCHNRPLRLAGERRKEWVHETRRVSAGRNTVHRYAQVACPSSTRRMDRWTKWSIIYILDILGVSWRDPRPEGSPTEGRPLQMKSNAKFECIAYTSWVRSFLA